MHAYAQYTNNLLFYGYRENFSKLNALIQQYIKSCLSDEIEIYM